MSSSSPAAVAFRSSSSCSSVAAPAVKAGPAERGGCRATSFHASSPPPPSLFYAKFRHSRHHDTGEGMQTPRLAGPPSAAASGPGPKSAARGVESNLPVQLHTPPGPVGARPKVGGERRTKRIPGPAAHPSAAPSEYQRSQRRVESLAESTNRLAGKETRKALQNHTMLCKKY